jgi:hypothetical protein
MDDRDDCTAPEYFNASTTPALSKKMTIQRTKEEILKLPKELRNLIAGGMAGMVAKSVVAPIDRIKILYQVSAKEFRVWDVPRVARKIMEEEGIEALWKGNTATLIRVFPYSGIQFMVFDKCKAFYLDRHEDHRARNPTQVLPNSRGFGLSPVESLIAGSIAGAISVLCTYPLDVTRAQLAVIKRKKDAHNLGFVGMLGNNYKTAVSQYSVARALKLISTKCHPNTKKIGHARTLSRNHTHHAWDIAVFWHCICTQRTREARDPAH